MPTSYSQQQSLSLPSAFQRNGQREDSALMHEDGTIMEEGAAASLSNGGREDDLLSPLSEANLPSSPSKAQQYKGRKASRLSLLAGSGKPGDGLGGPPPATRLPTATMQRVLLALAAR